MMDIVGHCPRCGAPICSLWAMPPATVSWIQYSCTCLANGKLLLHSPPAPSSAIKRPRLDKALARCRKRVRTAMNQLTGELTQP